MKKVFLLLILFVTASISLFSFGVKDEAKKSVSTDGSTSMEKAILSLAEVMEEEHGIVVTYNPTGSGSGIEAVRSGRVDIGLSSRDLKDSESSSGLVGTNIAIEAIAIIVNKDNPIDEISQEEARSLFSREIQNWAELGGDDRPVSLIGREAGSGTRTGFEQFLGGDIKCVYNQELTSTGAVVTAVASNPNAIGYASVNYVNDLAKILKVDGLDPTEENVRAGNYKIISPFVLVTSNDHPLDETAKAFFDFVTSDEGASIINDTGAFAETGN